MGGAAGREGKKVAKSADDLDKELEAFMGAPAPEAPAKVSCGYMRRVDMN